MKRLFLTLFALFIILRVDAQDKTIYLNYDNHSKTDTYYIIKDSIRVPQKNGITTQMLNKYDKIKIKVHNIPPEFTGLFFKLKVGKVQDDKLELSEDSESFEELL